MRTKYKVDFNIKAAIFLMVFWALVIFGATNAHAAATMWCVKDTKQCTFGTPATSKLSLADRKKALYEMYVADYQTAVANKVFVPKTASEIIVLAKALIATQVCDPATHTGTWPNCVPIPPPKPDCDEYTIYNAVTNKCDPIPCDAGFTGWKPVCAPVVVTPPVSGLINYTDGRPSIDTSKIPAKVAGYSNIRTNPTNEQPTSSVDNGAFRIVCDFSHMNFDDPIVFPNQQNATHLHAYFGNTGANYLSTPESIRTSGNSTCHGGILNRSAYWAPPVIDTATNAPVKPSHVMVYYKHSTVEVIPRGLRMIAGDAKRTTTKRGNTWFECNEVYANHPDNIIPCGQGGKLTQVVAFPACWDGKNLDSPNHKDHMAFTDAGVCPATHPRKLPTITMIIHYPIATSAGTANWRLSSDMYAKNGYNAGYSSHADFMMGWEETTHKVIVDKCINAKKDCHAHLLGDGRMIY
jgi:hypothetical protein